MIDLRLEDGSCISCDPRVLWDVAALVERVPGIFWHLQPLEIRFEVLVDPVALGRATHWADGSHRIAVDPSFWAKLGRDARIGLIAHETAHCWRWRCGDHTEACADWQACAWGFAAEIAALDAEARL